MSELATRIATKVGIDEALAEKAVGIIMDFLAKSAPADKLARLAEAMPEMKSAAQSGGGGGGMLGGMMGAMAAMNALTSAGLSMGQVQSVTKETMAYAREKAGPDAVNDVVSSIPGLSQFI